MSGVCLLTPSAVEVGGRIACQFAFRSIGSGACASGWPSGDRCATCAPCSTPEVLWVGRDKGRPAGTGTRPPSIQQDIDSLLKYFPEAG